MYALVDLGTSKAKLRISQFNQYLQFNTSRHDTIQLPNSTTAHHLSFLFFNFQIIELNSHYMYVNTTCRAICFSVKHKHLKTLNTLTHKRYQMFILFHSCFKLYFILRLHWYNGNLHLWLRGNQTRPGATVSVKYFNIWFNGGLKYHKTFNQGLTYTLVGRCTILDNLWFSLIHLDMISGLFP